MRSSLVLSLLASVALASSSAAADAPAPALVRLMRPLDPSKPHPLADATGKIPLTVRIPDGVDAASMGVLRVASSIGGINLLPEEVEPFAAAHPELGLFFAPPRHTLLDVSKKWTNVVAFTQQSGATGKGVIVGIVDTGIDLTHPDFLDANKKTRVKWLLTAEGAMGLHKDLEDRYGCSDPAHTACAIYDEADIDALIAQHGVQRHDPEGHGTHVSSIAAGNGGISTGKKPKYVGMAPEATLIVAAPSTGGSFYDADLLKATQFIFDRADELGMPCVVNLSVGGDFGPHDGTSSLEQGLASMVGDRYPGRAIVVAAGNSGVLYIEDDQGPFGAHTEVHVAPSSDARVPILTSQSKSGAGYVWITFQPGDDVSVALEGPGKSSWVGFTSPGDDKGYKTDANTGGVINNVIGPSSPIGPGTNSAVVEFTGTWDDKSEFAVHMKGHGDASLWVTGTGDVGPESAIGVLFEHAMKQGTIAVPACDTHLLAVGCTVNRVEWKPLMGSALKLSSFGGVDDPQPDGTCYFSAAGPTPLGAMKPEISAPGGFVAAAMSADADPRTHPGSIFDTPGCPSGSGKCYVVDDTHAITIGTSMSAPHVSGAIALLFQLDPTLTQARATEVLQAGARYPSGLVPHEIQLGPGELDMIGALQALAKEQMSSVAPDLSRSWFVLSSEYARPDEKSPIVGTIELRRTDGSIASGLDGSLLSLRLENGVVLRPIAKVRHGLFQFAIAGKHGTGGEPLTVDVRYGGESIGQATLPIGADVWQATTGVDAASAACACSTLGRDVSGGGRRLPLALALAASAVALSRRRLKNGTGSRAVQSRRKCRPGR